MSFLTIKCGRPNNYLVGLGIDAHIKVRTKEIKGNRNRPIFFIMTWVYRQDAEYGLLRKLVQN